MRIIFLALAFPKIEKSSYLYTGLASYIKQQGHELTVVAPTYDDDHHGLQLENGVEVIRVPTMQLFSVGMIQKGIANLLLPWQYRRAIKKYLGEPEVDLIITQTPPITLESTVAWLKRKCNARVYLILRDIFPQNAVDLGLMHPKSPITAYFRFKEKKLYSISDSIGCMSKGNIKYIQAHNPALDHSKLHILSNWADPLPLMSEENKMRLRKKLGFDGKFTLVFGGNIGLPQKMENIVDLARACQDHEDIQFLIYGNGSEKETLRDIIATSGLRNIALKDSVSHQDFFKILQVSHVGLISLNEKFTIPNIPSKVLAYFNAKLPVLASLDRNTDFGKILNDHETGLWAEACDTEALKKKLLILYKDANLRKKMGENGYKYLHTALTTEHTYATIMKEIQEAKV